MRDPDDASDSKAGQLFKGTATTTSATANAELAKFAHGEAIVRDDNRERPCLTRPA